MGSKEYESTLTPPGHSFPFCSQQNFCLEILHRHPWFKQTERRPAGKSEEAGEAKAIPRQCGLLLTEWLFWNSLLCNISQWHTLLGNTVRKLLLSPTLALKLLPSCCSVTAIHISPSLQRCLLLTNAPQGHRDCFYYHTHTHLIEGCLSPSKPHMRNFPWLSTWLYWAPVVDGTVRPSFWKSLPTASG